jgi:hypothetical protein
MIMMPRTITKKRRIITGRRRGISKYKIQPPPRITRTSPLDIVIKPMIMQRKRVKLTRVIKRIYLMKLR